MQRNPPCLLEFARSHQQQAPLQVNVRHFQMERFRDAQSRASQQADQGLVSTRLEFSGQLAGCSDDLVNLTERVDKRPEFPLGGTKEVARWDFRSGFIHRQVLGQSPHGF